MLFHNHMLWSIDVLLRAVSVDGEPLQHAVLGEPFEVEVIIGGFDSKKTRTLFTMSKQAPLIKGVENFRVSRTGTEMRTVNGDSTLTYRYRLRKDSAPGGYHIGPAQITVDGAVYQSNKVELTVGDKPLNQPKKTAHQVHQPENIFLQLDVDKKNCMVGEKITATIRLYCRNVALTLHNIIKPDLKGITYGKESKLEQGRETIKGIEYEYMQVVIDMLAKEAGSFLIPAFVADASVMRAPTSRFQLFGFGLNVERQQFLSNTIKIHVQELPPTKQHVNGVGLYSDLHARVDHSVIKEGDGILLTLELTGNAPIEYLPVPTLNIKEPFKYYNSKNYMLDTPASQPRKRCFEYIVQGLQQGSWQIPAQKFTFFDTEAKKYRTLESSPLTIIVKPPDKIEPTLFQKEPQNNGHEKEGAANVEILAATGVLQQNIPYLPWFVMFLAAVAPLLFYGVRRIAPFIPTTAWHRKTMIERKAFKKLRMQLKIIEATGKYHMLYDAFIRFFASLWQVSPSQVSVEKISSWLLKNNASKEEVEDISDFLMQLAQLIFASSDTDKTRGPLIVAEAYKKINFLEKKL